MRYQSTRLNFHPVYFVRELVLFYRQDHRWVEESDYFLYFQLFHARNINASATTTPLQPSLTLAIKAFFFVCLFVSVSRPSQWLAWSLSFAKQLWANCYRYCLNPILYSPVSPLKGITGLYILYSFKGFTDL